MRVRSVNGLLPLMTFAPGTAGQSRYSEHGACPLPSRADHDIDEMECSFQTQPRAMATGQLVLKNKQDDPRSRDIYDSRIEATRENAAGEGGGGAGARGRGGQRCSDEGQQLGGGLRGQSA